MATPYPGNYSVPGNMWPGAIWPGTPLPSGLALYLFTGPEPLTYPDYIDVIAGHTLTGSPGVIYDIQPPPLSLGLPCAPSDGQWTAVEG